MAYDLGRKIYQLRKKRELTQVDLANAIGSVTRSDVSAWERGADYPSEEQLAALCKALDVSKDFFVGSVIDANPMSAMETDLLKSFRSLTQYGQRRLLRFADNLAILERDEHTVYHEEKTLEREVDKKIEASLPEGHEKIRCSFCGKPQAQCDRLIAGNGAYICNECVNLCTDILSDDFEA